METNRNEIRCMYCSFRFEPKPTVTKHGKRKRTYIECPRCGNGFEREFRWYDAQHTKPVAANG